MAERYLCKVDVRGSIPLVSTLAVPVYAARVFDCAKFFAALDDQRRARGLDWNELADELYAQSSKLNATLKDHRI